MLAGAGEPDRDSVLAEFLRQVAARAGDDLMVFDEALTASPLVQHHLPPLRPGRHFTTRGGSLGVGIPGAVGCKLAHPQRPVIGFTGDGGAMYTYQALWTAVRHEAPAWFVVCNNHNYELLNVNLDQYWAQRGDVGRRTHPGAFDLGRPELDFVGLARAMGADGAVVRKVEDVAAAVDAMFAAAGPFLVDVNTDDLVKR
jgi:benzoylformate decarboxylase